jgi:AcrR family transcriptional regulator
MKKDRRTRRTRALLHEALIGLMAERDYRAITIRHILERADVARSSFYEHFRDKDDLLFGSFQDVIDALPGDFFAARSTGPEPRLGLLLFEHVAGNKAVARAMFGTEAWNMVLAHLRNVLLVQARVWLKARGATGASAELSAHHLVGALLAQLSWWVTQDFAPTPAEMSRAYTRLCLDGLQEVP